LKIKELSEKSGLGDLYKSLLQPAKVTNARNRIIDLQHQDVHVVVKAIARALSKTSEDCNEILLSGIIDIGSLLAKRSQLLNELKKEKVWDLLDEPIALIQLPDGCEDFVNRCIGAFTKDKDIKTPKTNRSFFIGVKNLIMSIVKLWQHPSYQVDVPDINESTWGHKVLQPIVDFIENGKEPDLLVRCKATLERNGAQGPDKKFDIFGVYNDKISDMEILLGEISYGPKDETKKHTEGDRTKLSKGSKDSFDSILRNHPNPMFRMRKLITVEIPFRMGSQLIKFIKALYTFRKYVHETLDYIKEVNVDDNESKPEASENESDDVESDDVESEKEDITIPTFDTPVANKISKR
ncbi:7738_t:CDS:2, partial [Dentiscutata erythropus]